MKKVKVFGAILMMAVLMFTSCLGDGNNSITRTNAGVIRMDSKTFRNVMDLSEYESIYSPAFANMTPGACCYAYYELDYDLAENSNEMVKANGYYTVTVMQKEEVDQFYMLNSLTDTTKLMVKETPITNPVYENGGSYVKGRLFITHQIKQPEDQKTVYNLSYDPQFENIEKGTSGNRTYDIFLRATINSEGSKTSEEKLYSYAYNMDDFFKRVANIEKGLGNKTFDIRFNYVSAIDTAKNVMTWKKSDGLSLYVETILPEE